MRPSPHVPGACEIEVTSFQINISASSTKCENGRPKPTHTRVICDTAILASFHDNDYDGFVPVLLV
jgi:hypothetical protein